MKSPEPPFIELSFYIPRGEDQSTFAHLVEYLFAAGAEVAGQGKANKGKNIGSRSFAGILDDVPEKVSVGSKSDFSDLMRDPDTRLFQVNLVNAVGVRKGHHEVVTHLSISDQAVSIDKHPIAIWVDGSMFDELGGQQFSNREKMRGAKIFGRFLDLVREMQPSYAAITASYSLECPTDLRDDARSYAFGDFFLNSSYFSDEKISEVLNLYSGAHVETLDNGYYISSTPIFNSSNTTFSGYRQELSGRVAEIIAETQ